MGGFVTWRDCGCGRRMLQHQACRILIASSQIEKDPDESLWDCAVCLQDTPCRDRKTLLLALCLRFLLVIFASAAFPDAGPDVLYITCGFTFGISECSFVLSRDWESPRSASGEIARSCVTHTPLRC